VPYHLSLEKHLVSDSVQEVMTHQARASVSLPGVSNSFLLRPLQQEQEQRRRRQHWRPSARVAELMMEVAVKGVMMLEAESVGESFGDTQELASVQPALVGRTVGWQSPVWGWAVASLTF